MPEYPPKFELLPEGVAGFFLLGHCPGAGRDAQEALVELFKLYWKGGYDAAREKYDRNAKVDRG